MPIVNFSLVHICEPGDDPGNSQIRLEARGEGWNWHVHNLQLKIRYCPNCGEKLEMLDA